MPAIGQIRSKGPRSPYLALSLRLDPSVIAAMLVDLGETGSAKHAPDFSVSVVTADLIDAWLRMMRLVDRPNEVTMLAPMIEREILFRVLQGPQGNMLRQIASPRSVARRD